MPLPYWTIIRMTHHNVRIFATITVLQSYVRILIGGINLKYLDRKNDMLWTVDNNVYNNQNPEDSSRHIFLSVIWRLLKYKTSYYISLYSTRRFETLLLLLFHDDLDKTLNFSQYSYYCERFKVADKPLW